MPELEAPRGQRKPAFGYARAGYGPAGTEYARCDGAADLATGHRFSLRTRVNCGSVGKLVTAHFVTRVWSDRGERERLRIGALLPGVPDPVGDATVEECLTHTTGLWDFRSLVPLFGERSTFAYGISDVLEIAARQGERVPGFERQYSNTNYFLLGLAVERETGIRLEGLVDDWLGPGVGNFVCAPRVVVPGRARGYEVTEAGAVLEFGSFVDGRGSTNFWANAPELAALMARMTDGYTVLPHYGGLRLSDEVFYAAGQDGGFRAGAVVDVGTAQCHVALTNDPASDPLMMMDAHGASRAARPAGASETTEGGTREQATAEETALAGSFLCSSLGVRLALARAADGALVVSVGDRVLGRLGRRGPDTFSDGHLDVVTRNGAIFLSINHAQGIPGCQADLLLVPGETITEAVVTRSPQRTVVKRGRVVVTDGVPAVTAP